MQTTPTEHLLLCVGVVERETHGNAFIDLFESTLERHVHASVVVWVKGRFWTFRVSGMTDVLTNERS